MPLGHIDYLHLVLVSLELLCPDPDAVVVHQAVEVLQVHAEFMLVLPRGVVVGDGSLRGSQI